MPPQRSRSPGKGKKYHLEFSRTSLVFWTLGMFFLLAWIFVLGILVGRGFLPEGVKALSELKAQITRLQDTLSTKDSTALEEIKGPDEEPRFAFYDELSAKRKENIGKDHSTPSRSRGRKRPDRKREEEIKPSKTRALYALQIASVRSEIKAAGMVKRLTNAGYPAYFYKVNVKGKTYYRVRCGTFKTKKEAGHYRRLLAREERLNSLLVRVQK